MKKVGAVLAVLALIPSLGCAQEQAQQKPKTDLKAEIRAILRENPDLVMDVLREQKIQVLEIAEQGARARQEQEREQQIQAGMKNPLKPALDPSRPVLGNPQAPITIVEYSDFLCQYCGRAALTIGDLMRRNPGKFNLRFKHFALHDGSREAAIYFEALALQDQAKAWKFYETAFEHREQIAREKTVALDEIARATGADMDRLHRDTRRPDLAERVDADTAEARSFGFQGTPSFIINGVPTVGAQPVEEFEKLVRRIEQSRPPKSAQGKSDETCIDCLEKDGK